MGDNTVVIIAWDSAQLTLTSTLLCLRHCPKDLSVDILVSVTNNCKGAFSHPGPLYCGGHMGLCMNAWLSLSIKQTTAHNLGLGFRAAENEPYSRLPTCCPGGLTSYLAMLSFLQWKSFLSWSTVFAPSVDLYLRSNKEGCNREANNIHFYPNSLFPWPSTLINARKAEYYVPLPPWW